MPFDPKARLLFTESGYRVYEASDLMELYTLVHKVTPFATKTRSEANLLRDLIITASLPSKNRKNK